MKVTRNINGKDSEKILQLDIAAGWKEGTKVTFPGDGDEINGCCGDVVFIIKEKKHDIFIRDKDNLIYNISISLNSRCGFKTIIKGVDGKDIPFKSQNVIQDGTQRILHGQGMISKDGKRGDLIIRFHVESPH